MTPPERAPRSGRHPFGWIGVASVSAMVAAWLVLGLHSPYQITWRGSSASDAHRRFLTCGGGRMLGKVGEGLLGARYGVLNFGMPGNNMPEHLQELDVVLPLHPNFVLLQLYVNDFETPNMRRPQTYPLLPSDLDKRLVRSS